MKLQIYRVKLYQKQIPAQKSFCEFCEISYKTFFKEPFGQLLLRLFKNDATHIFRLSISSA